MRDDDAPQEAADVEGQEAAPKRIRLEQAPDERARELREAEAEASATEAEVQLLAAEEQLKGETAQFEQRQEQERGLFEAQQKQQRERFEQRQQQERGLVEAQQHEQRERVQKLRETAEQQRALAVMMRLPAKRQ